MDKEQMTPPWDNMTPLQYVDFLVEQLVVAVALSTLHTDLASSPVSSQLFKLGGAWG